jgi:hypothetical protein
MHHPLYILSLLHPLLSAAARANESVIRNGKSTVNDEKTAASVASAGTTTEVLAKDKDKPSGGSALCNGGNFQLSRDGSCGKPESYHRRRDDFPRLCTPDSYQIRPRSHHWNPG